MGCVLFSSLWDSIGLNARNGVQKTWKWTRNEQKPTREVRYSLYITYFIKFTTFCIFSPLLCLNILAFVTDYLSRPLPNITPHHLKPNNHLMTNDSASVNCDKVLPCTNLSKSDSFFNIQGTCHSL